MYFVYIVRTFDNSLYIGVAENVNERMAAHNSGKGAEWTKAHRGGRLVYSEPHVTLSSARKREVQLKKWSPAKKEALIVGDVTALKKLSRSRSSVRLRRPTASL